MFRLKKIFRIIALSISVSLLILVVIYFYVGDATWITERLNRRTVASRLAQFEEAVDLRIRPLFDAKNVQYPPKNVKLVFLKEEKLLRLYAGNSESSVELIKIYPVLAASGKSGPKLREGDMQVPEGIYRVESLNPNSLFHLSLKVNYPNAFDKEKAAFEGRTNLGGDIRIHGKNVSAGCVAIGDEAIEELFILAAKTKYQDWELIFAPTDLTSYHRVTYDKLPLWIRELDLNLQKHLKFMSDTIR